MQNDQEWRVDKDLEEDTRFYFKVLLQHFFFNFLGWGKTESTWHVGQYLAYCTSPG
jgi:hypothetical protein